MSIAIKAENDWRDVGPRPSCNASQLPRFLVITGLTWKRLAGWTAMHSAMPYSLDLHRTD